MLNGDVLTDVDLTAQLAQHEATGAVGTLGARARRGSVGLRAGPSATPSHAVRGFFEKPAPSQLDGIEPL